MFISWNTLEEGDEDPNYKITQIVHEGPIQICLTIGPILRSLHLLLKSSMV